MEALKFEEMYKVKPKSYENANNVNFVRLFMHSTLSDNVDEVKNYVQPLQPVQILPDVDNMKDFPAITLYPKLEMIRRVRRVYDIRRKKLLYCKPKGSSSTASLFLLAFVYRTHNSLCKYTLMDIAHHGHWKIDEFNLTGIEEEAGKEAENATDD